MEKKIISLGLVLLITSGIAVAANCDEEWMQEKLESAAKIEKTNESAAGYYSDLALCSVSNKDYNAAIEYGLKKIDELTNKPNDGDIYLALAHVMAADYYSKNGSGFNGEIREHCETGETLFLREIDKQLARDKPAYSSVYSYYSDIANCYKLLNDTEKACFYCEKNNEYRKKGGTIEPRDCSIGYHCPKSSLSDSQVADSGGGLSFVLLVMAFLSAVILGAVFLLVRRKK